MVKKFTYEEHQKRIRKILTPPTPVTSIKKVLGGLRLPELKLPRIKRRG